MKHSEIHPCGRRESDGKLSSSLLPPQLCTALPVPFCDSSDCSVRRLVNTFSEAFFPAAWETNMFHVAEWESQIVKVIDLNVAFLQRMTKTRGT